MHPVEIQRKYSVFISSSFKDLKEIRRTLLMEVLRIGHIPTGMEMFLPGDARNLKVIESAIRNCDIFLILVGARMGEVVGDEIELAYTNWEYELAQELGKPTIGFLLDQTEYEAARSAIPANDPERKYDDALNGFRTRVQNRAEGDGKRIVGFFSYEKPGTLRAVASDAIQSEIASLDGGGWVTGTEYDELLKRVHFDATVSSNPFFHRFADRLSQFDKLTERTTLRPDLKRSIAQYFWKRYLPKIALSDTSRLFFESGSSIAFLTQEFIKLIGRSKWGPKVCKELKIATNNILTFLDFALIKSHEGPFDVVLEPKGPFEPYYGATFGELTRAVELWCPKEPRSLHEDAIPYVEAETKNLDRFFDAPGMILMTASGVDLEEGSSFRGPHVGSYYNQLVKRCLLTINLPTVMFLDEEKFPYPFRIGKCYPVCGPDFEWDTVRSEVPLALGIAAKNEESRKRTVDNLEKLGFANLEPVIEEEGVWPIIGANDRFAQVMALSD